MSPVDKNTSIWVHPDQKSAALPESAEVLVIGAGITGLSIAQRLQNIGVDVFRGEKKPRVADGMATRGMGIASILLLDPPFRLIQAVGLEIAKEITRFTREGVSLWGPRLNPTGVGYLPKGDIESNEVVLNLQALEALGLPAEPWERHAFPELGSGWIQTDGGTIDPQSAMKDLSEGLRIATNAEAVAIDDDGFDLLVRTKDGATLKADLVIMTGGAQITPWADTKFHPVRHQALATEPLGSLLPYPTHFQYGYTSMRQTIDGRLVASGCRWATPHLEVGETDDSVTNPAVHSRLQGFLKQHIPQASDAAITNQWSGIMTFTCDGLPVIGPLPGRPRIISCGGFGAFSPSLALRAAKAVVDGITTGTSPGVPQCFSTQRFE